MRTGAEFLAASWMAAATGGKAPIDLAESAYRTLGEVQDVIRDPELPLWRIAPFGLDDPGDRPRTSTGLDCRPNRRRSALPRRDRQAIDRRAGARGAAAGSPWWWCPEPAPRPGRPSGWPRPTWRVSVPATAMDQPPRPGMVTVARGLAGGRFRHHRRRAGGDHRVRPDRQPRTRRRPTRGQDAVAPPQRGRPAGAQAGRLRRPRPARHRQVHRPGQPHLRRRRARIPGRRIRARASGANPATGCSSRPTRSTCCPATSAARCRP